MTATCIGYRWTVTGLNPPRPASEPSEFTDAAHLLEAMPSLDDRVDARRDSVVPRDWSDQ